MIREDHKKLQSNFKEFYGRKSRMTEKSIKFNTILTLNQITKSKVNFLNKFDSSFTMVFYEILQFIFQNLNARQKPTLITLFNFDSRANINF